MDDSIEEKARRVSLLPFSHRDLLMDVAAAAIDLTEQDLELTLCLFEELKKRKGTSLDVPVVLAMTAARYRERRKLS